MIIITALLPILLVIVAVVAPSATEAFVPGIAITTQTKKNTARPQQQSVQRQHGGDQQHRSRLLALKLPAINLPSFFGGGAPSSSAPTKRSNNRAQQQVVDDFIAAWNARNATQLVDHLLDCNVVWDDYTAWYRPLTGRPAVERELRLRFMIGDPQIQLVVVDDSVLSSKTTTTTDGDGRSTTTTTVAGLLVHLEETQGRAEDSITTVVVPNSRRLLLLEINNDNDNKIVRVEECQEPAWASGEGGLQVLSLVSKLLMGSDDGDDKKNQNQQQQSTTSTSTNNNKKSSSSSLSPPERYFAAWNVRDMEAAAALFTEDAVYDDTAFPGILQGKTAIRDHLNLCADAFPPSFTFCVDEVVGNNVDQKLLVRWHVEQNGAPLPFTRGLSFYKLAAAQAGGNVKIRSGLDIVDGQPIKTATIQQFGQSVAQNIRQEPARLIPLAAWIAYMYIVFFSNGILPGADALQLEQRTWDEVLNLSLNFFLVAPALGLPFSPVVHPMLEGVFNWLLSWAALFAGFLSDDRRDKPNVLPMLPIVVGMQFLTSAFLLPYLATRSTETRDTVVVQEDLTAVARVTESRLLGPVLAVVGAYSMVWAVVGRTADFGALSERWGSFLELLSIDRVGSSFLVDLAIFALFQAWLVDDDLRRRGVADGELPQLRLVGKFVPFFGMAAYMALRPQIPSSEDA